MIIYRCTITLLENTFFCSREINNFYQTEPLIGNYALAYAFGFVRAPYFNSGEIHYYRDLTDLNNRKIYITPAKVIGSPKFILTQYNATSDTYWSRVEQNAISVDVTTKSKKARPLNYPQIGWLKLLGIGTTLCCYIVSEQMLDVPSYLRLGKFMSKAHVNTEFFSREQITETEVKQALLNNVMLNPLDLPLSAELVVYDVHPIHPVPLISNVTLHSRFFQLPGGDRLPIGLHFGLKALEKTNEEI